MQRNITKLILQYLIWIIFEIRSIYRATSYSPRLFHVFMKEIQMLQTSISYLVKKPNGSNFDLDISRKLLELIDIAHQEFELSQNDQSWEWDKDTKTPKDSYELLTRFGFAAYFFGKRQRVPFGFIVRQGADVFVVFRGTLTPAEWISNAKAKQEPFLDNRSLGEVHLGFHKTYVRPDKGGLFNFDPNDDLPSMKEVIEKSIKDEISENDRVFVTGHSLGGALASLSALHINQFRPSPSPILYTFASPRVGDDTFVKHFHELECYRISNSEDRVPNLPWSVPLISLLFPKASFIIPRLISDKLSDEQNWEHLGQPIYFTAQWGSVPDNHTIPVYKKALELS